MSPRRAVFSRRCGVSLTIPSGSAMVKDGLGFGGGGASVLIVVYNCSMIKEGEKVEGIISWACVLSSLRRSVSLSLVGWLCAVGHPFVSPVWGECFWCY